MKTILVTGATGSLGRATMATLIARGFRVRAASRHPQPSTAPNVQTVHFDYTDPATHRPALEGSDGVLLIAPPLDVESPAKLNPVIDLARELGVGHVVLNSALGVDADENAPLRRIERHLIASGVSYTILRPNFFMENFTTGFLAPMVRQGEIYLAAGDGKTSFISACDIAAVAAESFSGAHTGREYSLTGPEALDHHEVAQLISRAAGRTVSYHAISEEEMLQGAIQNGLPESAAHFMALLYSVVRNGWAAGVTDDVQEVTGKAPLSFAAFAGESSAVWK
ncbi:SDR family oxidoreductase [Geobacter grbiciae]|uniref:SDR family oxidoreductase n=1 Tax=Geobacter grbiciae TaxID=155042 RepID=UPI001C0369D4|nr:SDR family oxidoreductase [Geobacter grbiciae]MBT1077019.1 SDR family oxidoreductase [Geobacter grbiciae]